MKSQPKIAIYVRTATVDKDSRQKLDLQISNCRDFALQKFPEMASGKNPFSIYEDMGFSAMDIKRPALNSLFTDLKLGKISFVIVVDMTRLFRKAADSIFINTVLSENKATAFDVNNNCLGFGTPASDLMESVCRF